MQFSLRLVMQIWQVSHPFAPNPCPQSNHVSGISAVASRMFCHTVQMSMCLALRPPVILNDCISFYDPLWNSATSPLPD